MNALRLRTARPAAGLTVLLCAWLAAGCSGEKKDAADATARPALTVTAVQPKQESWPLRLEANGSVAAWQEASVGAEIGGLRLAEVLVNVGDAVKKGQVLARMSEETVRNDLAQQRAAVQVAEASLAQARHNLERARGLESSGSVSRQEMIGYETQEATAAAQLASARALLASQELRLAYTQVLAPDDGTISARSATVGAVAAPGGELFKLIRQNRLEWRAELRADELAQVRPGQTVEFSGPHGAGLQGKVRQVAPTVDVATRTGLVYVDVPPNDRLKAGMFVTAALVRGAAPALAVPQVAIVVRDGAHYAFRIGADGRATKTKVATGRRQGSLVEITEGLKAEDRIAALGAGFLHDGDQVKVVDAMPGEPKAPAAPAPKGGRK